MRDFRLTRHGFTVAEGVEFTDGVTALHWTDHDHEPGKVLSGPTSSVMNLLATDDTLTLVWDDESDTDSITCDGLTLFLEDGLVTVGAHPLGYLPPLPRRTLACLLRNPRQTVTIETLIARLYPGEAGPASRVNAVQVNLVTIRRLLGPNSIETVRGVGYRLGYVRGMTRGGEPPMLPTDQPVDRRVRV